MEILKKIIAGNLSALMLTSCIGGSVNAVLPANHIPNLVGSVQNGNFHSYLGNTSIFNRGMFNRTFFMSYFTRNENNMRLGEELIRRLFEAELSRTYTHTYSQLLNQYNGNVAVQNALEEINGFVERSDTATIDFDVTGFVWEGIPVFYMEDISPELLNRLRHMRPGLQRAILRMESLRSLYYLIQDPNHLLDRDIPVVPEFLPIFRPWREDRGLVAEQGYHRLYSDLVLLSVYSIPNGIQELTTTLTGVGSNTLFSNNEGAGFSGLIDIMDALSIRSLRGGMPGAINFINDLVDQLENIYG